MLKTKRRRKDQTNRFTPYPHKISTEIVHVNTILFNNVLTLLKHLYILNVFHLMSDGLLFFLHFKSTVLFVHYIAASLYLPVRKING